MRTAVQTNLIVAHSTADGFTWTLASRLGEMLYRAEQAFGPRDSSYTILGIEFTQGAARTWSPGDRRHIVIQLSVECLTDDRLAYWQLAHESVHLLSPTGGCHANVLEEGMATLFSETYCETIFGDEVYRVGPRDPQSYAVARDQVKQLLELDPAIIRNVRKTQPQLHLIRAEEITAACPRVPGSLAASLVASFVRE